MVSDDEWAPYVPVAKRRANAAREANKLLNKGQKIRPIHISSRSIATSFWGVAWCKNLEMYADWANRLPRGRNYARNGSIVDLQIETGKIAALVSGSSLYKIKISIDMLPGKKWDAIRIDCAQQVISLLELMRGKLPDGVLARLTDPKHGMFPSPKELKMQCSCPDYATMCKHVAAVLYGIGHLLDSEPSLFFKMRGVDQAELVSDSLTTQSSLDALGLDQQSDFSNEELVDIFGIEFTTLSRKKAVSVKGSKSPTVAKKASKKANPRTKVTETKKKLAKSSKKATTLASQERTKRKLLTKQKASGATKPAKAKRTKRRCK